MPVLDNWDHLGNRINFSGTFYWSKNVPKTLILILRTFQTTDIYLGLQGSMGAVSDTWDHLRNRINFLGTFSGSKNVPKILVRVYLLLVVTGEKQGQLLFRLTWTVLLSDWTGVLQNLHLGPHSKNGRSNLNQICTLD